MTPRRGARWALVAATLLALVPGVRAGEPYAPPTGIPAAPSLDDNATPSPDDNAPPSLDDNATPSPDDNATVTGASPALDAIRRALGEKRFGTAVLLCEQLRGEQPDGALLLDARAVCARALVELGDKLYAVGSLDGARQRWEQAAALDPRLLDDPAFTARLEAGESKAGDEAAPKDEKPPRDEAPPEYVEPPVRPPDAGVRWDRGFGAGIGAGFDGVGSLLVSWMTDGTIAVDFAVGLVFPVLDIRVRWFGMQEALTPVVGLGMTTPFSDEARFGDGLDAFHNLYELGEFFHLDIGASWAPTEHLDVFAGVVFVTPVDQEHPDTVLFFPQLAAQVVWYF